MTAPDPLTTEQHDIRGIAGFVLDTQRLLGSETWAMATGDEAKAAVTLWCRAWTQTPAGSVPNDDRILASWCGLAPRAWLKVKDIAMRGFVLCSDGRLYHRVLCEDVRRAHARRVIASEKGKRGAQARHGTGIAQAEPTHGTGTSQGMHDSGLSPSPSPVPVPFPVPGEGDPPTPRPRRAPLEAPAGMPYALHAPYAEIAAAHPQDGREVAARALAAARRLHGGAWPSPDQLRQHWRHACERGATGLPSERWPDWRQDRDRRRLGEHSTANGAELDAETEARIRAQDQEMTRVRVP